jgi:hypothetical protein
MQIKRTATIGIFVLVAMMFLATSSALCQFTDPTSIDSLYTWWSSRLGLPDVGPGTAELRTWRDLGEAGFSGDQWDDQMGNHNLDEVDLSTTGYPKYIAKSPAWDYPSWYMSGNTSQVTGFSVAASTSIFDWMHKDSTYAIFVVWWARGSTGQLQTIIGNNNAELVDTGFMLSYNTSTDALQFLITKGSSPNPCVVTTGGSFAPSEQVNITIVNHHGGNTASIYNNGTIFNTNTGSGSYSTSSSATNNLYIGVPTTQTYRDAFGGHLYELGLVRGDTISAADITSLTAWAEGIYKTSPYPAPSALDIETHHPDDIRGLMGWWSADSITGESDGDTLSYVRDLSGNGHPLQWVSGTSPASPPRYVESDPSFNGSAGIKFHDSTATNDGEILHTITDELEFWTFTYGDTSSFLNFHGHTAIIVYKPWTYMSEFFASSAWLMGTTYLANGTSGGPGFRYEIATGDSLRRNYISNDQSTWMINASKNLAGDEVNKDSAIVDVTTWEYDRANNDEWHKQFTTVMADSFGAEPTGAPFTSFSSEYPFSIGRSWRENFGALNGNFIVSDVLLYNHALTDDEYDFIKTYYLAKIFNVGTIGGEPGEALGGGRGANIIRRRGVRRVDR